MKKNIISTIALLILIGTTKVGFADDLIFTRKIIERNNGVVSWNDGRVDINYLDKELSLWIDKNEVVVNGEKKIMKYKPTLLNGQTILPKEFYENYLDIKETFKDSNKKIINTTIVTKPEVSWDKGGFITEYTHGTPDTTPAEIIEKIQEIIFYLEKVTSTEIDISDMKVTIHKGLKKVNDNILGQVLRGSGRITFWDLEYPDYLNSVVVHEIGHYIESKFLSEKDFKEYITLRGLEEEYFNSDSWERKPVEVFAEDFSNIFDPNSINRTDALTMNQEELEIFKDFLFKKIQKGEVDYN